MPGKDFVLLLRKQFSKHIFGMHATLTITNRDILADRAAIVIESVSGDNRALLGDGGVCFPGDLILNYCG